MEDLYIPSEVWNCVARYYENPILLLRLAEVCRNSYRGATMDSAWETLIPYECEGRSYRAFIKGALSTTENNRCIIRCCWTGSFPPKDCFPKVPFERKDYDTAFALAAYKEHLGHTAHVYLVGIKDINHRYTCPRKYSYLFGRCVQSRKFMVTALHFSPWIYDTYYDQSDRDSSRYVRSNPGYCELAMRYSTIAWISARTQHFSAWEDYDLRKQMLTLCPRAFTCIFSRLEPCSDPEFILGSAPYYLDSARVFVKSCHPRVFDLELCEKLCRIGFPIWVAKPGIGASFLKQFQCFTRLPPRFKTDREIFESVAKNRCEILQDAIPEFRRDISLVMSIFEHNPGVLHYCDASIFTDAGFLRCFKEALRKPNYFFSQTLPSRWHPGFKSFPEALQTQELALIAVESCGRWIHNFPLLWDDLEVMKVAVVTWPHAYRYAPGRVRIGKFGMDKPRFTKDNAICKIDPRAVWFAGRDFVQANRSIVRKSIQLEPLLSAFNYHSHWQVRYGFAINMVSFLPEILRAHHGNYEVLCMEESNRRVILGRKNLVIAALEGTRDSSILWDVHPEILDEDIWRKAREVRRWKRPQREQLVSSTQVDDEDLSGKY